MKSKVCGIGMGTGRTGAGALSAALVIAMTASAQPARAQGWMPPPPEQRCPPRSQWGANDSAWFGMAAPKGIPVEIVTRLNREINDALADPKLKARLAELGGDSIAGSPADFWKLHAAETEKWAKVVKSSGAKVE